ncbi:MAG: hypothetical protein SGJ11_07545, partial [Phycisphaerae bacterium]|nr:hypothetical protein [Phycisphaerae bacterium]
EDEGAHDGTHDGSDSTRLRGRRWRPTQPDDWSPRRPDEPPRRLRSPHVPPALRRAADIIDELMELGPTVEDPMPLVLQVTCAAVRMAIELARPSDDGGESPLARPIDHRSWAAALYAVLDAPQARWTLLHDVPVPRGQPVAVPAWEQWSALSDRRAAWSFGVGLPRVAERSERLRHWFAIDPDDCVWIAPATRSLLPEMVSASIERAQSLEVAS